MQAVSSRSLAQARAKLYRFMSQQYLEPLEPDFLRLLSEWAESRLEADGPSGELSERMREGQDTVAEFFRNHRHVPWPDLAEEVSIEFVRLFRGVKEHFSPPPPYESVYREESGRVFGEVTMTVLAAYRRAGFEVTPALKNEPPDHLSFELEFMGALCSKEAEAWKKDDQEAAYSLRRAESDFLADHLLGWLPMFRDKVQEYDRLGLFRGLIDVTEGWVDFDFHNHTVEEPTIASGSRQD